MKKVSETKAGQSISAFVVIAPNGKQVSRVHAHYADSGRVTVDVYDWGTSNKGLQQCSAGGGGYDKFTAAIRGMIIDGITLVDHSATNAKSKVVLELYLSGELTEEQIRANFPQMTLCNYHDGKYQSLYVEPGLEQLKRLGYTVIQAI